MFEQVLGLLRDVGESGPLLLVLEDLHWADASTRDLLAFLGRNLSDAAVALVLTYRAEEVTRRHPLRPTLANLERDVHVERIELTGLDRVGLEALLDDICERPLDAHAIDGLLARSGGNPFYVEELVAAGAVGTVTGGLPGRIADVLLARAAALPVAAQDALRAAAVLGDEVDDDLLGAVVGRSVTGILRDAVECGLLVLDGETCRFRHALVREALYDDLMPGERVRLHIASARAIEEAGRIAEHVRWAKLAHHWDAAHEVSRAFTSSVRAAAEAERVQAFADAGEQYERALALREQVPDADRVTGMTHVDLLLRACDAVAIGTRGRRALVLAETALRDMGAEAAPERRALVYERIGRINWKLHHGPAAVVAYEAGATLVADRPPSREKALVLSALGQSLMLRQLYREALEVLRAAIDIAAEVGADDVQGHARCSLGPCLIGMGQVDEAVTAVRRAIELSTVAGTMEDGSRAYANLMSCLYAGGRYTDAAAEIGTAIEHVVRSGHVRYYGQAVAGNAILSLYCAGRWDEAERLHADPRIPNGEAYQELRWLPLLFGAGRLDEARALVAAMLKATADADDVQFRVLALLHAAELAMIDDRPEEAREIISDARVLIARTDDQLYAAEALGLAAAVATRLALRARDRRDDALLAAARAEAGAVHRAARVFADETAARGAVLLPEPQAWLTTVQAEHASATGAGDEATAWANATSAWDEVGQPMRAAEARYRQADALMRSTRERDAATRLARSAQATATRLGAAPLAERIRRLGERARLDLNADATPEPAKAAEAAETAEFRLPVTPREREVLRLLAQGRTNRQIGEVLFISEKTASVHVTNVLRKLGVSNRVEAAAVAARAGLG